MRLAEWKPDDARMTWRMFNGLPAIVTESTDPHEKWAPRVVTTFELDANGNIKRIFNVLATRELTAVQ
jgi:hypothetical protein